MWDSSARLVRIILDPGYLTRSMFKIVYFSAVTLLDDLLPSAGEQLPKITTDDGITHWIFYDAASCGHPARRYRARGIHIWV
jgi:hypothetical protein